MTDITTNDLNPIYRAAAIAATKTKGAQAGWKALGDACGVTYMAVKGWAHAGRLPLMCVTFPMIYTYHKDISRVTNGEVSARELYDWSRTAWEEQARRDKAA